MIKIIPAICPGCNKKKILIMDAQLCFDCFMDVAEIVWIDMDESHRGIFTKRLLSVLADIQLGARSISVAAIRQALAVNSQQPDENNYPIIQKN